MSAPSRPGRRDWVAAALLGVVLGSLVLGMGGRLAMRGIALLRPIDGHRLALFLPLVILYGAALQLVWCRIASHAPSAGRSAA